jgi:hypothetical protein
VNWHLHLHVLAPAGAFRTDGCFVHSPVFAAAVLRDLFQANVLALQLKERMISPELVERMRVVGFITQPPVILQILNHIGRRFDPLKLPGRSPPP